MTLKFASLLLLMSSLLSTANSSWSYGKPPAHVVWIEGEDCTDHNWTGETRHNWWHGSAPLSGRGLLELTEWEPPEEGEYFARFPFEVSEAGEYTLYFRGRTPGWQSSPITWQINDGPRHRYPPAEDGTGESALLAHSVNHKVSLIRLGTFEVPAGRHMLTIRSAEPYEEPGASPVYFAGIDSLSIARTVRQPVPEILRVTDLRGGPREDVEGRMQLIAKTTDVFDPAQPEHKGLKLAVENGDWRDYSTAELKVLVEANAPVVQGRLRCYYDGSKFRDLVFAVEPKEYDQWLTFQWDLDKEFEGVSRAKIASMWLYSYGGWYSQPVELTWKVAGLRLIDPKENSKGGVIEDGRAVDIPLLGGAENRLNQVVWDVARDEGEDGEFEAKPDNAKEPSKVILSGPLKLALSPSNAGLRSAGLARSGGRDGQIVSVPEAPPAILARWRSGKVRSVTGPPKWETIGNDLVYQCEDEHLAVKIVFQPNGAGEVRIRAEITNKSDEDIDRIRLLPLRSVALGGTTAGDTWNLSTFVYPAEKIGTRLRLVSPQQFNHDSVTCYDGEIAFNLRWEDKGVLDTECVADYAEDGVSLALAKFPRIAPGRTWQAPELVVSADATGSWHAAADRFRAWWESWARRPELPGWFHGIGGCSPGYTVKDEDAIAKNDEEIQNRIATNGILWGHTPLWIPRGTEAWYPQSFRLTGPQVRHMREVTDALRDKGARITTYSNPLMISRLTPEYASLGREVAVVNKDGFFENTEHHLRHHPMVLPQPSAAYATRWLEFLEPAIVEGKPDVFYIDQLGAVPLYLDYEPARHGHEHFGQWTHGQVQFLDTVEKRLRPLHPDLTLMVESFSAPLMQYALALFHYGDNRVFRYTFPDYYAFVGYYNKITDPEKAKSDAMSAFVFGLPLLQGWHGVAEMDESVKTFVKDIVALKRKIDPRLHAAKYRDRLDALFPDGLEGALFAEENGGWLVTVANPTDKAQSLQIAKSLIGPARANAARWHAAGATEALPLAARDGAKTVSFPIPPNAVGLIEIPATE